MTSMQQVSRQWCVMQSIFAQLIERLSPGDAVYSPSQYATASWQHKLRKWHDEIDDLIQEYPLEVSIAELEASYRQLQASD